VTGRSDQKKAVGPKKGRSDQIFRSEKNQRAQAHRGVQVLFFLDRFCARAPIRARILNSHTIGIFGLSGRASCTTPTPPFLDAILRTLQGTGSSQHENASSEWVTLCYGAISRYCVPDSTRVTRRPCRISVTLHAPAHEPPTSPPFLHKHHERHHQRLLGAKLSFPPVGFPLPGAEAPPLGSEAPRPPSPSYIFLGESRFGAWNLGGSELRALGCRFHASRVRTQRAGRTRCRMVTLRVPVAILPISEICFFLCDLMVE
jgi:hypothetical protein